MKTQTAPSLLINLLLDVQISQHSPIAGSTGEGAEPDNLYHRGAEQNRRLLWAAWLPRGREEKVSLALCSSFLLRGSPIRICSPSSPGRGLGGKRPAVLPKWTLSIWDEPSRVPRKSSYLLQYFLILLLYMSCVPVRLINQWNAGFLCYCLLIFSPKCLVLCWAYYGYTKKFKIKTKNTGRRAEREGRKGKGSEGDLQAHLQDKWSMSG